EHDDGRHPQPHRADRAHPEQGRDAQALDRLDHRVHRRHDPGDPVAHPAGVGPGHLAQAGRRDHGGPGDLDRLEDHLRGLHERVRERLDLALVLQLVPRLGRRDHAHDPLREHGGLRVLAREVPGQRVHVHPHRRRPDRAVPGAHRPAVRGAQRLRHGRHLLGDDPPAGCRADRGARVQAVLRRDPGRARGERPPRRGEHVPDLLADLDAARQAGHRRGGDLHVRHVVEQLPVAVHHHLGTRPADHPGRPGHRAELLRRPVRPGHGAVAPRCAAPLHHVRAVPAADRGGHLQHRPQGL
ncbi:MAG: ABC transporter, permease protein 2 (cluster 1, maltose/g3p/polyamine/iron), partial [uncultured Solirubrobacteraceae bacterium]